VRVALGYYFSLIFEDFRNTFWELSFMLYQEFIVKYFLLCTLGSMSHSDIILTDQTRQLCMKTLCEQSLVRNINNFK